MTQNQNKLFERLCTHLHRGGAWWYVWLLETKVTFWIPTDKPYSPISQGKTSFYFSVHPTTTRKSERQRATIGDIATVSCVFCDFDAKSFGDDKARAWAHVESLTPRPSVIVDSGGGFHCYWLLAETFHIKSDADRARAKRIQAAWVAFVGGDQGAKDLARVLRVPGTLNHKYTPPRRVEIVRADFDCVYTLDELERAADAHRENEMSKSKTTTIARGNGHSAYAQAALQGELDKLAHTTEGARNNQLNASAFALGQLVGAGVLDRTIVETELERVALAIGLGARETRATIRSGIEAGIREPRVIPDGNGHDPRGASPRGDDDDEATTHPAGSQYVIRNGRICRLKRTQDGVVIVPLCNFTAHIIEEVTQDDGSDDVQRDLLIEGVLDGSEKLPTARVNATQFATMRWVTAAWGARAIVEAGNAAQDHLRAAIQYLSPNIVSRHVYTHTGWRVIGGTRVYLTQSGALGGDGIVVELDRELERYQLPTQPRDAQDAMCESLRFLEIAPMRVTAPLWAAMYLAPLAEIIPLRFMLWLYGATGVYKSALTAVALSHYGDFTQDDLLPWNGTGNSLEKYPFIIKDAPLVLDDFAPQTDQAAAQKIEQLAARLVRDVGNHAGRARMKSDLSLRAIYRPRGLVISTGEQLPNGQSLLARLVTIEVNKGDVNLARLTEAQDHREVYPDAMAGYILWLRDQWDALQATLPDRWKDLRARARQEGQHARLPESIASLYVGFDLGLSFACEIGALTETRANELRQEGWHALCRVAERQHGLTEEQRPTRRFLSVIAELVAQGKARLEHTDSRDGLGDGEMIGWYDDAYLYLLPSASYHIVARYEREEGRIFGVKENTLRKMLAEEGISVVSDETHLAARLMVGEQRKREGLPQPTTLKSVTL